MKNVPPNSLDLRHSAFSVQKTPTLADIGLKIESDPALKPARRRDLLSAINRIAKLVGRKPEDLPATPPAIRELLAILPAPLGKAARKSQANLRSLVTAAVRQYAPKLRPLTERIPPSLEWEAHLKLPAKSFVRIALYRLAAYCTAVGLAPDAVSSSTLSGLHDALEKEALVKQPRGIVKNTISAWNRCAREIPEWPKTRLSSPFKQPAYALPLENFPDSFQEDVDRFIIRIREPDAFDIDAPPRALRSATVDSRKYQIRQLASGLIHRKTMRIEDITSLSEILKPERFKEGLRYLFERNGKRVTQNLHNTARALKHIARHYCKLPADDFEELNRICARLDPRDRGRMTARNRERLQQFDDPANVTRLLEFTERQWRRAKREKNSLRAAKRMETGLVLALMLAGLRLGTIRQLEPGKDFKWVNTRRGQDCHYSVPGAKIKSHKPKDGIFAPAVSAMLRDYIDNYRPGLPGAGGPYLFAAPSGAPRSAESLRRGLIKDLQTYAGLEMHPHLTRHALGKIVVEADPNAYALVSRVLGHSTVATTLGSYLGTEGNAMARHLDAILEGAKSRAKPKTKA